MTFQNNSNQEMMSEINVTPLVDVMLVLLVVFIVTAPLLSQSLEIRLPKTVAVTSKMQSVQQTLAITAQGKITLDTLALDDVALAQKLQAAVAQDAFFALRVQADEAVPYGRVAQIMAIAQRAGVSKLSFVTTAAEVSSGKVAR